VKPLPIRAMGAGAPAGVEVALRLRLRFGPDWKTASGSAASSSSSSSEKFMVGPATMEAVGAGACVGRGAVLLFAPDCHAAGFTAAPPSSSEERSAEG